MSLNHRNNAIGDLVGLYTVVIGVALSLSVVNLLSEDGGLKSISTHSAFLFLSFIVTLFPFYHGALRHIDKEYISTERDLTSGAFVIDFILLFFHALAFVVLSMLMQNPGHFGWILVIVCTIDVIWGTFAYHSSEEKSRTKE